MKPTKQNPKRKRNVDRINQIMILTGIDDLIEIERLLAKLDRQKRIERRKAVKKKRKKPQKILYNQPLPLSQPQIKSQKQQVSIDANIILPFIKLLIDKGLITPEEIQSLTLKQDNPLKNVDFKIEGEVLDKGELRQYWLYLMKHNELFCALCGHPITEKSKGPWRLTAEHTIPRSEGGKSDSTNLVPAHEVCNNIKTNIMPEEWNKVGLEMLRSYGIHVDLKHSMYKYTKEIQR